jgi:hypothetical protein
MSKFSFCAVRVLSGQLVRPSGTVEVRGIAASRDRDGIAISLTKRDIRVRRNPGVDAIRGAAIRAWVAAVFGFGLRRNPGLRLRLRRVAFPGLT